MIFTRTFSAAAVALAVCGAAHAETLTIALPDIGAFTDYTSSDASQTFAGNGFVGMYSNSSFVHLFGLEGSSSRAVAQANISAVAGRTIVAATFSFQLLETENLGPVTTVTGYAGDGALAYRFDAPVATYATAASAPLVAGLNVIDITSIVTNAAAANAMWLNLHFASAEHGNWTYTWAGYGYGPDRAEARLTIDYAPPVTVPEPASWTLMIFGFGLVGVALRRRAPAVA